MSDWKRQLLPWVLVLSLGANACLGYAIWKRDARANLVWANQTIQFVMYLNWSHQTTAEAGPMETDGLSRAMESMEAFQWFPHADKRLRFSDYSTVRRFLTYALSSASLAAAEQKEKGSLSSETKQRQARINQALFELMRIGERRNELQHEAYTWQHGKWRAIWSDMARVLSETEFVPLPNS